MKILYVAAKRILLTTGSFYVERGDILTFDVNRNTLTIHRAHETVKTMLFPQGGLNVLVRTGMIQLFDPIPGPTSFPGQLVNDVPEVTPSVPEILLPFTLSTVTDTVTTTPE